MSINGITTSPDTGLFGTPVAILNRDPLVPNPEPPKVTPDPTSPPDTHAVGAGATSASPLGSGTTASSDKLRAHQLAPATFSGKFAALLKAVRSDDVVAAQRALSTLKSDSASVTTTYSPAGLTPHGASNTPALTALLEAVRHGSATSAKAALAQLESDALHPTNAHKQIRALDGQQFANRARHRANS